MGGDFLCHPLFHPFLKRIGITDLQSESIYLPKNSM